MSAKQRHACMRPECRRQRHASIELAEARGTIDALQHALRSVQASHGRLVADVERLTHERDSARIAGSLALGALEARLEAARSRAPESQQLGEGTGAGNGGGS